VGLPSRRSYTNLLPIPAGVDKRCECLFPRASSPSRPIRQLSHFAPGSAPRSLAPSSTTPNRNPLADPSFTDWHKLYNRADSAIRHADPALGAPSLANGDTRRRAFELLAGDVKRSLNPRVSEAQERKNLALRVASLDWAPDTPLVRELQANGIRLAKSTWPGAAQLPFTGDGGADGGFGFMWKCNKEVRKRVSSLLHFRWMCRGWGPWCLWLGVGMRG